jgi:hypothetical protein
VVLSDFTLALLLGDINRDGTVDRIDAAELIRNLGSSAGTWGTGDFDFDGVTGISDWMLLRQNLGVTASPAASLAAVPEPTTLTLTVLGLMGCAVRWRRRLPTDRQKLSTRQVGRL